MRSQVLESLNREWADQHDRVQADVIGWGLRQPALAGCVRLADVLDRISEAPDPTLAALIDLDRGGSALAARTVLQTMLGKMVTMAAADRRSNLDDYIVALWCQIRTYPLSRRPFSIAANLALDTRKAVRREQRRRSRFESVEAAEPLPGEDAEVAQVIELSALRVLHTAHDLGLIDESTRRVLAAVYAEGRSGREVAELYRLSQATVRFRCSRAVRMLADRAVDLAAVA